MDTTKLTLIVTASALMHGCAMLDTQPSSSNRDFSRSESFRYGNGLPLPEVIKLHRGLVERDILPPGPPPRSAANLLALFNGAIA